jgi:hypothetical protein
MTQTAAACVSSTATASASSFASTRRAAEAEQGNFAALSPAQIDSFKRAIQIDLADDDAMPSTIKRNLANNPVK